MHTHTVAFVLFMLHVTLNYLDDFIVENKLTCRFAAMVEETLIHQRSIREIYIGGSNPSAEYWPL